MRDTAHSVTVANRIVACRVCVRAAAPCIMRAFWLCCECCASQGKAFRRMVWALNPRMTIPAACTVVDKYGDVVKRYVVRMIWRIALTPGVFASFTMDYISPPHVRGSYLLVTVVFGGGGVCERFTLAPFPPRSSSLELRR